MVQFERFTVRSIGMTEPVQCGPHRDLSHARMLESFGFVCLMYHSRGAKGPQFLCQILVFGHSIIGDLISGFNLHLRCTISNPFWRSGYSGYINFLPKKSPFPKKWSNASPEQFFAVSSENTAFSKKINQHNKYLASNFR